MSAYHIDFDGALTSVIGSPFVAGTGPWSVAVDLLGRFVYLGELNNGVVDAYHIGFAGVLSPVAGSPFQEPGNLPLKEVVSPVSLAVDPLGRFLYTANEEAGQTGGNNVSAYRIGTDGSLTLVAGSPFMVSGGVFSIVTSP